MNITIYQLSLRNINLQLQTLIAREKKNYSSETVSKNWYYYLFICWIQFYRRSQNSNSQIWSQEKIKIKIILILIIDYYRFVEIESEAYKVCRNTD